MTEDLCIVNISFKHTRDHTKQHGMQDNKFDHGSCIRTFNTSKCTIWPGQFKLDPFLITTGILDSVINQTIFEANIYESGREDILKTDEDRNKIVVPLLTRIADIERNMREENDPSIDEDEEQDLHKKIKIEDNKLPTINQLHETNKEVADKVLTTIQNGCVTRIKS